MRCIRLSAAIVALLFIVNHSSAQGTISFYSCYPQGGSTGTIQAKGSFTLDCGWKAGGTVARLRVWQDGCLVSIVDITISSGTFAGSISGLQSSATYNVTVEMVVLGPCSAVATIVTDPGRATAP